jgi:hypothetical protein
MVKTPFARIQRMDGREDLRKVLDHGHGHDHDHGF